MNKSQPNSNLPNVPVDIIGRSCRLPGARNVEEFWTLLSTGKCSVSHIDPERFSMFRYSSSRRGEPGKSYSFAAGVLDDIWGFDPAVFSISPREAAQMDPQQRLLLMLVHEALEDGGMPPSSLSDRNVGVFVGNSGIDHNNRFFFDPAGTDPYMMTGNTGALISNRISYIFDFHGPSKTIDTACSSSLVALDDAVNALRGGQIDMAIVAGVNLLLSPFPFVGFSAASMLSEEGLCRPFDKQALGYVRAEGGVVLVLQRGDSKSEDANKCHARIVETGVNSDGRTIGVALPSPDYQAKLLEEVYGRAGVNPKDLSFIEAHGTGTRVGDPAEAEALGRILGTPRSKPLPIGSVKSNIGHLEPASGIAGLLKAMLSLEHSHLPASLHFDTPNPDIPFDELNIKINDQPLDLVDSEEHRYAGVSNFGFGGTNVHVILTDPPKVEKRSLRKKISNTPPQNILMLSARCRGALKELAGQYGTRIENGDTQTLEKLASATVWQRETMAERLVTFGDDCGAIADALHKFGADIEAPNLITGRAPANNLATALVYTGNGSQWAGMGQAAFEQNNKFAAIFKKTDTLFMGLSNWSLVEALFADDLAEQLMSTRIAQPLLFALQVALTGSLRDMGLEISAVIGHSVGEVAAGWASGALSLEDAVAIIHARSEHQESVRGKGLMVAVMLPADEIQSLIDSDEIYQGINISAINSARSVTISGPTEVIEAFVRRAKRDGLPHKLLNIDYPFHNELIDPVKDDLIRSLEGISPGKTSTPYYSTVTGAQLEGKKLGPKYWWDNVRRPVLFYDAGKEAIENGCRLFLEIGPKPLLRGYLNEISGEFDAGCSIVSSLSSDGTASADPVRLVFAKALASGASYTREKVFGADQKHDISLPLYPWQNKPFKLAPSQEAIEGFILSVPPHPLLGQRIRAGEFVWDTGLDSLTLPFLVDHKVDGKVILPGAAFAEIALAASGQWLESDRIEIRDMDILQPLILSDEYLMEIRTRIDVESNTVEIKSRKRLSGDDWQLHVKCRVGQIPGDQTLEKTAPELRAADNDDWVERLYKLAKQHGIDFGPMFQRMIRCEETDEDVIEIVLDERAPSLDPSDGESTDYVLHPLDLDACFHGLNILYDKLDLGNDKLVFIPVRLGTLRVYHPCSSVRTCRINILRANRRGGQANFELFNAEGRLVATLADARFRAAALVQRHTLERISFSFTHLLMPLPGERNQTNSLTVCDIANLLDGARYETGEKLEEQRLLIDAAARRATFDALSLLADDHGAINIAALKDSIESTEFDQISDKQYSINRRLAIVSNLLVIAEQSGMAAPDGTNWQLSQSCPLPPVSDLLTTLLEEEPRWLADCVLLNHATRLLPTLISGSAGRSAENSQAHDIYSHAMLEQMSNASPLATAHIDQLSHIAKRVIEDWPKGRPLRVLELGVGGVDLTRKLLPMIAKKHGILVAADTNKHAIGRLKMSFSESAFFEAVTLDGALHELKNMGPFDLIISANSLHMLANADQAIAAIEPALVDDGKAIISLSEPDAFHDLIFGAVDGWFDWSIDPEFPLNPMKHSSVWRTMLETCGFTDIQICSMSRLESATIIIAARTKADIGSIASPDNDNNITNGHDSEADHGNNSNHESNGFADGVKLVSGQTKRSVVIAASASDEAEVSFSDQLKDGLHDVGINGGVGGDSILSVSPVVPEKAAFSQTSKKKKRKNKRKTNGVSKPSAPFNMWEDILPAMDGANGEIVDIVHLVGAFNCPGDPMGALSDRLKNLTHLLQSIGSRRARLWIIAPGGARALTTSDTPDPVQSGIWAFGRTAINEYGDLDIKLVDFGEELDQAECAERLVTLLASPGQETELVVRKNALQVLRVKRGLATKSSNFEEVSDETAILLNHPTNGSLDQMRWEATELSPLKDDGVKIEVKASGLNFRDAMWAQGLLPEEALEDGFSGPTLGFECSGRILAVGRDVKMLNVGDPVMALAPACFASHVTVSEKAVAKLPPNIDLTAAATIPVAFLTAYYALHHLAHLEEDEWVLIHGAAGGVGLAALQLAKWRKAKVIATAGSDEKRALLTMLGADHVLNTRSLDFVDQIRTITADGQGGGVDVVLNSLNGEAMERSIELVRPFGRFLELGKRDFYGNTKIGLRPFRRNISYYGIDADQLLNRQAKLFQRRFGELTEFFQTGCFKPLPYRLFESSDIVDAFRLMQQSGHIGKILINAPSRHGQYNTVRDKKFMANKNGAHVIIGGLGGFGLEAATWLADHGAKSIILTSRSGTLTDQARDVFAHLKKSCVDVEVACCDVSDTVKLGKLLEDLQQKQPIKGIIHAAMVLEDELIQNLTGEQIENVLRSKVAGAHNLDRLTSECELDYFVMFSSAAALFGNPGQAHYVAANAYMDGLARQRRLRGLPALAVGWGAITDVGVLSRQKDTAKSLARHTGGIEFKARQALDLLGQLLASDTGNPEEAVVTLAAMNWAFAGDTLPIMAKPVFTLMAQEVVNSGGMGKENIDILSVIDGLNDGEAQDKIAHLLAVEVSAIIRLPIDEIDVKRSLSDIGMDSLMGMELRTAAQQKLGIDIPMVSIADGTTINKIAAKILTRVRGDADENDTRLAATDEVLVGQHIDDEIEKDSMNILAGKVREKREQLSKSV